MLTTTPSVRQRDLPYPERLHTYWTPTHLPIAVLNRSYGGVHQSLGRKCQQRAYELVRDQHALTIARVNGRNFSLSAALRHPHKYVASWWVRVYNSADIIRQGSWKCAENKGLNWIGTSKIIAVDKLTC